MKHASVWIVEVQVFGGAWEPRRLAATKALAEAEKKRLAIKPARVRKYIREQA
jgi:hypothetical protein